MTQASRHAVRSEEERLVTVQEAAHILGLSVRAVYRLVASQELPGPVKIGRATRFPVSELWAYIEQLKARRR